MVPPSDNIEFFESAHFKKAMAPVPGLRVQILNYLRAWPKSGVEFCSDVRELKLAVDGVEYAVIYRRKSNRLGIMHIFQLPEGKRTLDDTRAQMIKLFGIVK